MKVAELIAKLQQQDPDAEVLYDGEASFNKVSTVIRLNGSVVIA